MSPPLAGGGQGRAQGRFVVAGEVESSVDEQGRGTAGAAGQGAVGVDLEAIIRRAVDFPEPEGPTNTMKSPSGMSKVRSLTAGTPPG
jgi:hypothetical protein